ncbi:hypothetical protein, partial [endosymbiont of Riftia pachyptila]|uniref:hypothetical protein n=1 Tax=endosymbiont of Riftia pachyptila TaxID=54396 RepID=UPI001F11BE33
YIPVGEEHEQEAVALRAIFALNLDILNHNRLRPDLIRGSLVRMYVMSPAHTPSGASTWNSRFKWRGATGRP